MPKPRKKTSAPVEQQKAREQQIAARVAQEARDTRKNEQVRRDAVEKKRRASFGPIKEA